MIITRTPFRMSFFGGGTDFPDFYKKYGGAVISTTFDKYCYLTVRHLPRFFEYSSQIVYSRIESVKKIDEIEHPAVREAMKYLDMHELRISYDADLPARSGLGTSSSFAVGLLNAFYALKGKYADKRKLADDAIYLEKKEDKYINTNTEKIIFRKAKRNKKNKLKRLKKPFLWTSKTTSKT